MSPRHVASPALVFWVMAAAVLGQAPSEEDTYLAARRHLEDKSYKKAQAGFEDLLARFPEGPRAREATYRAAWCEAQLADYEGWEAATTRLEAVAAGEVRDLWRARALRDAAALRARWALWNDPERVDRLYADALEGFRPFLAELRTEDLAAEFALAVQELLALRHDALEPGRVDALFDEAVGHKPPAEVVAGLHLALGSAMLGRSWSLTEERRARAEGLLAAVIEEFPATEAWGDACLALAEHRAAAGRFLEAKGLYERISARWRPGEHRHARAAAEAVREMERPRLEIGVPSAFLPGVPPVLWVRWRNLARAEVETWRSEPARAGAGRGDEWDAMVRAGRQGEPVPWELALEDKGDHAWGQRQVPIPGAEGLGVYWIVARGEGAPEATAVLLVTDLALVVKGSHQGALVWCVDALSGRPVAGAAVRLAWHDGGDWRDAEGTSDEQGTWTWTRPEGTSHTSLFVRAQAGDRHAIAHSSTGWWSRREVETRAYVETDRPAYRPGETVHFRCVTRHRDPEGAWKPVAGEAVMVRVQDPSGERVLESRLEADEFGTVMGELALAEEPPLGMWHVQVEDERGSGTGWGQFRVEEYKLPEFRLSVTPDRPDYRLGDTLGLAVRVEYYFGGPVSEAEVEALVYRRPYWHAFPRTREFPWYYEGMDRGERWAWGWGPGEHVATFSGRTDAEGAFHFDLATAAPGLAAEGRRRGQDDVEYTVEVRAVDRSRREVTGTSQVRVTEDPWFVLVEPARWVHAPGDRVEVRLAAASPNGKPVSVEGRLLLERAAWNEERGDYDHEEVRALAAATGADGEGAAEFVVEAPGYYRLRMVCPREGGPPIEAAAWFWVAGEDEAWLGYHTSGLKLAMDRDTYRPGDRARVLVASAFEGATVLLSVEAEGVVQHQVLRLAGRARALELPVEAGFAPNVHVTAALVRDARMHVDTVQVVVPPVEAFIHVEVKPDRETVRPGEAASLEVSARGHDGAPVDAQVSLAVVDESVHAIQSELALPVERFFYGEVRPLAVYTTSSFQAIRYRTKSEETASAGPEGDGGGDRFAEARGAAYAGDEVGGEAPRPTAPPMAMEGAARAKSEGSGAPAEQGGEVALAPVAAVREDFRATAFWAATVRTGAEGRTTVRVELPDSLTEWRATARAFDRGPRVGQGRAALKTQKNLMCRLQAPRFFVERDQVTISAIVNNRYPEDLEAEVSLDPSGLRLLGEAVRRVTVPAGGEARVDWACEAVLAGTARLTASARTRLESDAMARDYPVLPHGMEQVLTRVGSTRDRAEVVLRLPEARNPAATRLSVTLSPSIAAAMLDALPYLAGYPYGCVEQTLSRFVPSVIVSRTLRDLGVEAPEVAHDLPAKVRAGLARLHDFQHADGGWGWWRDDGSRPWMTSYVAWGLALARDAGAEVDPGVLDRACAFLLGRLVELDGEELAFALHALAQAGRGPDAIPARELDRAWEGRDRLDACARALLSLAFHRLGDARRATVLLENLEDLVVADEENGTAHFGRRDGWWRWSEGAVQATSHALRAYVAAAPGHPLVPRLVKWMVHNRRGERWDNTRDTAVAVLAFTDYLRASRELAAGYQVHVSVNGARVRSFEFRRDDPFPRDRRAVLELPDEALRPGENRVLLEREGGEGTLYWSASLAFYTLEEDLRGDGHEVLVARRYERVVEEPGKEAAYLPLEPGAPVKSGDRVRVTLTLESKNDYEYILVEDPKPAGLEAVETHSGWRWEGLGYQLELRDERVALFLSDLPEGRHEVSYLLRAEVPGAFHALPARAEAMYVPEVRGTGDEARFQVLDR
ncbi:MAG: hypothetical protein HY722_00100 [Planctomycetes bacterium]|nr:hypothetical protein [Planctomycetota bacterium]